jgi:putative hydrolase of HD superfamily
MSRKSLTEVAFSLINLARTGWMLRGIPGSLAETVAEHSFMSALICMELSEDVKDLDVEKMAVYALLHDLGEAFIGDVVKNFSSSVGETKERIELESVEKGIENELAKKLYGEYSQQQSREAKMAKLCNYIATYIMGLRYREMGFRVDDIIENTKKEIEDFSRELGVWEAVKRRYSL